MTLKQNSSSTSYGIVALRAREIFLSDESISSFDAWKRAAEEQFPKSPTESKPPPAQNKSCPRCAFVGLCEAGFVRGVPGIVPPDLVDGDNKQYAIKGAKILMKNSKLPDTSPATLWEAVMAEVGCPSKTHNQQMNVVLALWESGYINPVP